MLSNIYNKYQRQPTKQNYNKYFGTYAQRKRKYQDVKNKK